LFFPTRFKGLRKEPVWNPTCSFLEDSKACERTGQEPDLFFPKKIQTPEKRTGQEPHLFFPRGFKGLRKEQVWNPTCSFQEDSKACEKNRSGTRLVLSKKIQRPAKRTGQEEGLAPAVGLSARSLSVSRLGSSSRGIPFNRNSCVGYGIRIDRSRKSRAMR